MKKSILALLLCLFVLQPQLYGQIQPKDTAPESNSNFCLDMGKTLVYTGGGVIVIGAGLYGIGMLMNALDTNKGPEKGINVVPAFGIIGMGGGAAMALLGVPFWMIGKNIAYHKTPGGFRLENQEGYETRIDITGIISPPGADLVTGYNFNEHWFLGGGLGFRTWGNSCFPFYVDARYTITDERVAPYIGLDLGGAYTNYPSKSRLLPYYGINLGSRIRSRNPENKFGDWWIAATMEMTHHLPFSFGLKVGYSF